MIIEEPDFKLTLSASGTSWDLELLRDVKSRDGSVRYEFKLEGYGIPIDKCMQIIINYRLCYNIKIEFIIFSSFLASAYNSF